MKNETVIMSVICLGAVILRNTINLGDFVVNAILRDYLLAVIIMSALFVTCETIFRKELVTNAVWLQVKEAISMSIYLLSSGTLLLICLCAIRIHTGPLL
ncbi:MAG: hypothetical protein CR972_02420 [Candidatus Moraniibacteriota bacterium]|nr:MAG: hypothetical protein CR972_02420 [Candidatus Moranbacteria bacterium]